MTEPGGETRYKYTWASKPWIGILLAPVAVFLARSVVDEIWLLRILVWLMALVIGMAALGTFISTSVQVDRNGELWLWTRLAGLHLATLHLEAGVVQGVELNAHFVAMSGGKPGRPLSKSLRLRLELRHPGGVSLIHADAVPFPSHSPPPSHAGSVRSRMVQTRKERIWLQSRLLASVLDCPLKLTGDGWGSSEDHEERIDDEPAALRAEALRADERKPIPRKTLFIAGGGSAVLILSWLLFGIDRLLAFLSGIVLSAMLGTPVVFVCYLVYRGLVQRRKTRSDQIRRTERNQQKVRLDALVNSASSAVARDVGEAVASVGLGWFHTVSEASPPNLSIWFVFPTDADYESAVASGLASRIDARIREELRRGGHPADLARDTLIRFKTHERLILEVGDNYKSMLQIRSRFKLR